MNIRPIIELVDSSATYCKLQAWDINSVHDRLWYNLENSGWYSDFNSGTKYVLSSSMGNNAYYVDVEIVNSAIDINNMIVRCAHYDANDLQLDTDFYTLNKASNVAVQPYNIGAYVNKSLKDNNIYTQNSEFIWAEFPTSAMSVSFTSSSHAEHYIAIWLFLYDYDANGHFVEKGYLGYVTHEYPDVLTWNQNSAFSGGSGYIVLSADGAPGGPMIGPIEMILRNENYQNYSICIESQWDARYLPDYMIMTRNRNFKEMKINNGVPTFTSFWGIERPFVNSSYDLAYDQLLGVAQEASLSELRMICINLDNNQKNHLLNAGWIRPEDPFIVCATDSSADGGNEIVFPSGFRFSLAAYRSIGNQFTFGQYEELCGRWTPNPDWTETTTEDSVFYLESSHSVPDVTREDNVIVPRSWLHVWFKRLGADQKVVLEMPPIHIWNGDFWDWCVFYDKSGVPTLYGAGPIRFVENTIPQYQLDYVISSTSAAVANYGDQRWSKIYGIPISEWDIAIEYIRTT